MDEGFWGELCSQAGWRAYGADAASGLALPGQTDPALPEVMIWVNVVGGEICRKQSSTGTDSELGGGGELVFKI